MPGGDQDIFELLRSLMVEPIYKGSLKALAYDILNDVRDENLADESISSFFNRRFEGPDITNNVISAIIHGIYAGDIDKLSIKSLFPTLWDMEKEYTTILGGLIVRQFGKEDPQRKRTPRESHERNWRLWLEARLEEGKFANTLKMARAYTFVNGVGTLTNALESSLKSIPDNVEIRMNEKVTGIEYDAKPDRIKVCSHVPPRSILAKACIDLNGQQPTPRDLYKLYQHHPSFHSHYLDSSPARPEGYPLCHNYGCESLLQIHGPYSPAGVRLSHSTIGPLLPEP